MGPYVPSRCRALLKSVGRGLATVGLIPSIAHGRPSDGGAINAVEAKEERPFEQTRVDRYHQKTSRKGYCVSMARLTDRCKVDLAVSDFQEFPIWTWNDEQTELCPVDEHEADPGEHGVLFIRAKFYPADRQFDGYLIGCTSFYAFALFIGGHELTFNLNLSEEMEEDLPEIYRLTGGESFPLFPLRYESDIRYKDGTEIAGWLHLRDEKGL